MLFFIAAECIAMAVVFGVGFLNGAIEDLGAIAPWFLTGAGVGLLMTGIHLLIALFRRKREKLLFWIAEAVMLLSLFPGVFFFAELLNLDLCRRWMPWFGENLTAQLFTTLAFLVAVSLLLLFLAYLLPLLPLLLTILLPVGLYCFGLKVCTQSYSDYMTTYMEGAEPVEEYVLTSDAEIYYPSFEAMGRYCFLQKESYSRESFSEGDVVYLLSSMVAARFREQEYIAVSDGEKAGLVSVSSLERLDAPRYEYELRTAEEGAPLYRPEQKDGEKVSRSVICTLEAGEKLEYLQSLDGYLKVCLADGTEGYVKRSCVEIVRVSA